MPTCCGDPDALRRDRCTGSNTLTHPVPVPPAAARDLHLGGSLTGEATGSLARNGTLVSVGYSGGMQASVNVTDLIWKTLHVQGFRFTLFSPAVIGTAMTTLLKWLEAKTINPTIDEVFPLEQAAQAQRHLIEDRPFGRVLLTFGAP